MLEAIRSARQAIHFETFIVYPDSTGEQFRDAFCERAENGVEVRILLDGIGSGWRLKNSNVRLMKKAGCKFACYHPTHSWRVDRTNRRTHWRDVHLRVDGPLVAELQSAFQEHWNKTFGEAITGSKMNREIRC
jgi:cardiolipin synthase